MIQVFLCILLWGTAPDPAGELRGIWTTLPFNNPEHSKSITRTRKLWRSYGPGARGGERAGQHFQLPITQVSTWTSPSWRSSHHTTGSHLNHSSKSKEVSDTHCFFLGLVYLSPALPLACQQHTLTGHESTPETQTPALPITAVAPTPRTVPATQL